MPTLVNFTGVSLARVAWYAGHMRAIKQGDDADAHHYAAACYADVFVSNDGPLAEICALIPNANATPITVDAFGPTSSHFGAERDQIWQNK